MEPNAKPKPKKRPRFSLKVLLVLPALIAIYLSYGPQTRTTGVADVARHTKQRHFMVRPLAPLLIEGRKIGARFTPVTKMPEEYCSTEYYLWFHGYVWQLPYKNEQTRSIPKGAAILSDLPQEWLPQYSW